MINQHHVVEDGLDQASAIVVNGYQRFLLTRAWGSGKRVSSDGTQWDTYERNLLAEHHIRYGGFGCIAYYHVSNLYIALFSRFIPCGAYEGAYILDPFYQNKSEHPTGHGPRRHPWPERDDLRARVHPGHSFNASYAQLEAPDAVPLQQGRALPAHRYLFSATVDWDLIAMHLPDMLRVGISTAAGAITPLILLKLGTYSRQNRLYQAFRELGVAVRTGFLLQYIADAELRSTIQSATNKSESFNDFVKWLAFGGGGVIAKTTAASSARSSSTTT